MRSSSLIYVTFSETSEDEGRSEMFWSQIFFRIIIINVFQ
jgi:hypothetical protein